MRDNITLAIALLGSITGVSGLILNFLGYWSTRAKLKITISRGYTPFFLIRKDEADFGNYRTDSIAMIPVRIINKSEKPVTIVEVRIQKLFNKKRKTFSSNDFKLNHNLITFSTGDRTSTSYRTLKQINLPIRIEPFDIIEGSFRFPFFDDFKGNGEVSDKFVLHIQTTRQTFHLKMSLNELNHKFLSEHPEYRDLNQ